MKNKLMLAIALIASASIETEARGYQSDTCSLDKSMDYLKLAIQWQPGFCQNSYCRRNEQKFSIHGLWPGRNYNKFLPNSCCTQHEFDAVLLGPLRNRLNEAWPSLKKSEVDFWKHEFDKHGSCTIDLAGFGSLPSYFEKTLDLYDKLNLNQLLRQNNIPMGQSISRQKLIETMTANHSGRKPDVDCRSGYLREIRFCYTQDGQNLPIDCPDALNGCGAMITLWWQQFELIMQQTHSI